VLTEDDVYWVGDTPYCCDCCFYCEDCNEYTAYEDEVYIESEDRYDCRWCAEDHYTRCEHCGVYYRDDSNDLTLVGYDDSYTCPHCLEKHYDKCDECGEYYPKAVLTNIDGKLYCNTCAKEKAE
jgi:formylmethanofuran dehydrogenase subunit E